MKQHPMLQISDIGCDFSLCKENEKSFYYKFHIVPWQKLNQTTFFIIEDITPDIIGWIKFHYGDNYVLVKADGNQIFNILNSYFGVSEFAVNYLYYKNPSFSVKGVKIGSMAYASFIIIVSILTLVEKYAYFALIFIFIIGCSSSLFKFITLIFGLCRTFNRKADSSCEFPEASCPVYTILLPALKESAVIPQLIQNIDNLDYPKSQLDVKLLIESDDQEML